MATRVQVTPEEYLRMSFEGPDREYVDGEIVERNVGEERHAAVQCRVSGIFYELSNRKRCFPRTEIRLRLAAERYRIPDVALFAEKPGSSMPSTPPLVVVEIVSPDDRHSALIQKLDEYRDWGVANIWLVNPELRKQYVYDSSGLHEVDALILPEYELRITATDLFED